MKKSFRICSRIFIVFTILFVMAKLANINPPLPKETNSFSLYKSIVDFLDITAPFDLIVSILSGVYTGVLWIVKDF